MPLKPKSHAQFLRDASPRSHGRAVRDRDFRAHRETDPVQVEVDRLRACRRWRAVRQTKLGRDPLCETCLRAGITTAACDVNHTPSLREILLRGSRQDAYRLEGLTSLCRGCHNAVTWEERRARQQPAKGTAGGDHASRQ